MSDDSTQVLRDELHALRASTAAALAERDRALATVRAEVRALRRGRPGRTLRRRLGLAAASGLLALLPLGLFAAGPTFSDLGTAAPFHQPNIQALAAAGITTGFPDPNATNPDVRLYDPKANVTREEMASFLARTAGLGGNPPVANAQTAVSAGTATNAGNAATLGGFAPNGLVRLSRTVLANDMFATPAQPGTGVTAPFPSVQEAGRVALVAPGPGLVLVTVTATGIVNPGGSLGVRLRDVAGGPPSAFVAQTAEEKITQEAMTASAVFPVVAGAREFVVEATAGANGSLLSGTVITALFVPFDGAGAVSASSVGR